MCTSQYVYRVQPGNQSYLDPAVHIERTMLHSPCSRLGPKCVHANKDDILCTWIVLAGSSNIPRHLCFLHSSSWGHSLSLWSPLCHPLVPTPVNASFQNANQSRPSPYVMHSGISPPLLHLPYYKMSQDKWGTNFS